MSNKIDRCEMNNCNRPVKYKNSGLCSPCYSALYYWQKYRTPTEVMKRQKNLRLFSERMAVVSGVRGPKAK